MANVPRSSPAYFTLIGPTLAQLFADGGLPTCRDCEALQVRVIDPMDPDAPVDENTQYEPDLDENGNPRLGPAYDSPTLQQTDPDDPLTDTRLTFGAAQMTRRRGHAEVQISMTSPSVTGIAQVGVILDWTEDFLTPIMVLEFNAVPITMVAISELPEDPSVLARAFANEPDFVAAVLAWLGLT